MKRNEAVLVYAVTGVLLFILAIAVVFGGEPAGAAPGERGVGKSAAASLPGVTQALMNPEAKVGAGASEPGVAGPGAADPGAADPGAADPGAADPGPADPGRVGAEPPVGVVPPAAEIPHEGPAALSRPVVIPDAALENAFGTSERRGEYRLVKSWAGASLRQVVERWCGSVAQIDEVVAVNETVGPRPAPRTEILVPWVDAAKLLQAKQRRDAERQQADYLKGELYALKRGDSLWKVAAQRVANNQVPAWLEKFKKLNPEITNLSALVEGQKVRLPR
jgi:hypothetical protein